MKILKNLAFVFSIAFALTLAFGALQVSAETAGAVTTTLDGSSFSADLLNPDDRPQEALTSPFRQAVIGIMNYILTFLGLAAVAGIVYGGINLVTSQGDEEALGKAKTIIIYSAIGVVIVLLSFAIVRVIVDVKTAIA